MSTHSRYFRTALLAASVLLLSFASRSFAAHVAVSGIRFWTNEEYTRVAVDLGDEAKYEANFLRADPARGLPPRIFIDIEGADVREEILRRPVQVRNGLLKVVRAGRFRKGVVRVVIDLERESGFRVFSMADPFRIIVDIDGKPEGEAAAHEVNAAAAPSGSKNAAGAEPPETKRPGPGEPPETKKPGPGEATSAAPGEPPVTTEASEAVRPEHPAARKPNAVAPRHGRIRVMLDPGHGGKDPGAIGPTGLKEKDVVLAIGRKVRERLARDESYEVRMTRDTDVFIPLEERTAMANEARADIFVSLHINASTNRKAEGISTYVLSRASDRHSLELAARENGVPVAKLSSVKFIIDDLSTYGRKKESLKLAKTVNDAIVKKVNGRFGKVQDLGLKQAPFYVLVGARMTAVLVESSFITNRREEARLYDPEYLAAIADSVVDAIRYYGEKGLTQARAGL